MTARDLGPRAAAGASLLLLPAILAQGWFVRRRVPLLPEAAGPREGVVPGAEPALRLLVLGESTAAGIGAADHGEALGGQVAHALSLETGRAVRWRVLGKGGATAESTRRDLLLPAPDVAADVAVIALGVNDTLQFHGYGRWMRGLRALVEGIRGRCGPVPVVLAAVPPMGRFPALPQPLRGVLGLRASMLDAAAATLAAEVPGLAHVPMPLDPAAPVGQFFCADGFHPGPHGYAVWGATLARHAAGLLRDA
ncbi:MAG TPA: SGNH/GDSL hydrolase family protein [Longimicrobiaceae bacterium]|nr:SGNH/GDSL hydrolase family protein [Longimicrobiaceae bacterium]